MESINVIVETERLILRRYVEGDAQDLYEYLSNPEVVKYEPYKPMDPDEVKSNLAWRISTDEMIAVGREVRVDVCAEGRARQYRAPVYPA